MIDRCSRRLSGFNPSTPPLRSGLSDQLARDQACSDKKETPQCLAPFIGHPRQDTPKGLPFRLSDYLVLVDWTGRAILENKRGYIPGHRPTWKAGCIPIFVFLSRTYRPYCRSIPITGSI